MITKNSRYFARERTIFQLLFFIYEYRTYQQIEQQITITRCLKYSRNTRFLKNTVNINVKETGWNMNVESQKRHWDMDKS